MLVMSRSAQLYLLDEPIAGVDPAARDFILQTIVAGYNESGTVLISTHLITDVEKLLDEVISCGTESCCCTVQPTISGKQKASPSMSCSVTCSDSRS